MLCDNWNCGVEVESHWFSLRMITFLPETDAFQCKIGKSLKINENVTKALVFIENQ